MCVGCESGIFLPEHWCRCETEKYLNLLHVIGLRNSYYVNPVFNKIRIRTWLNVLNVHLIPFDTFCRSLPTRRTNSVQCNFVWNINDAQFFFPFPVFFILIQFFASVPLYVICRRRVALPRCVVKTSTCSADGIKLANDTLFFCFRRQCLDLLTKDSDAARQYLYRSVFSVRFCCCFSCSSSAFSWVSKCLTCVGSDTYCYDSQLIVLFCEEKKRFLNSFGFNDEDIVYDVWPEFSSLLNLRRYSSSSIFVFNSNCS